jgi:septation ring formation regulator EzrA
MLENGGSTDPDRDPTKYVMRDELFKEIGKLEGKIEQYRKEQEHLKNMYMLNTESVKKLTAVITNEIDDIQDVKVNIENMKKRFGTLENEIHSVQGNIDVINTTMSDGFEKLENMIKSLSLPESLLFGD